MISFLGGEECTYDVRTILQCSVDAAKKDRRSRKLPFTCFLVFGPSSRTITRLPMYLGARDTSLSLTIRKLIVSCAKVSYSNLVIFQPSS
jgi:hypothetical protein